MWAEDKDVFSASNFMTGLSESDSSTTVETDYDSNPLKVLQIEDKLNPSAAVKISLVTDSSTAVETENLC